MNRESPRLAVAAVVLIGGALIGAAIALTSPGWFLAVLIMVAVPAVLIAWRYPEAILALFLTAGAFKAAVPVPVDLTALLGAVLLLAIVRALLGDGWPSVPPTFWLFPVLVALVTAGAFLGGTPYGVDKAMRLVVFGLIAAVAAPVIIRTDRQVERFALSLGLVGGVLAATAWLMAPADATVQRLSALGSNTIALGRASGLAIGYFVLRVVWRRATPYLSVAAILLCTAALLGSGSRGPAMAVVIAGGMVLLVRLAARGVSKTRIALASGVVLIAGSLAWNWIPEFTLHRFEALLSADPGRSATIRQEGLAAAFSAFQQHPIFGVGTGGFQRLGLIIRYPHNLIAEIGAENGIFGVLVVVAWLASGVVAAVQGAMRRAGLSPDFILFALVFSLLNALVSGDLNDNRLLYAVTSLALARTMWPVQLTEAAGATVLPGSTSARSARPASIERGLSDSD